MTYEVEFKPRAIKELQSLSQVVAERIVEKLEAMRVDRAGDVKRRPSRRNTAFESAITGFSLKLKRTRSSFTE
jgi:mRNA-degrading endonuclease RelE of RelBE toxin-antitoxin system